MKDKIFALALLAVLLSGLFCPCASALSDSPESQLLQVIDGIIEWKQASVGAGSVQELADRGLAQSAGRGSAEWYVIAMKQYRGAPDFSKYSDALNTYAFGGASLSATDRQRISLAFSALGSGREFVQQTVDGSAGGLGVMSYIYGLLLMDSGAYVSEKVTRDGIIGEILSLRLSDGGWAVSGSRADTDITAMAVQALAPYYGFDDVRAAVGAALELLSARQTENGDFASWGTRNLESTAQVLCALCAMNIDWRTDARFIKNGNTLVDGMMLYRRSDGSFSHIVGGAANDTASVQALYSLCAAWRKLSGMGFVMRFTDRSVGRESSGQPLSSQTDAQTRPTQPYESADDGSAGAFGTQNSRESDSDVQQNAADMSQKDGRRENEPFYGEDTDGEKQDVSAVQDDNAESALSGVQIKLIIISVLAVLAAAVFLLMIKKGMLCPKNLIIFAAVTSLLIIFAAVSDIRSYDEYYAASDVSERASQTVSLSIRCDAALGRADNSYLPPDGVMLASEEYGLRDGDTVFTLLQRAVRENRIQMEFSGTEDTAYIKGIGYLYERDCGELSGWMYMVNGGFPGVGCGEYRPENGDVIEFVYSCDMGKDVTGE